jgi:mannose/fructose-specific phosphotransferase system component IIA
MSDPVRGVVLAHAQLAEALVRAVEQISGVTDALHPISNEGLRPEELHTRLEAAVSGEATIIFVDLSSGSCALAGRVIARGSDDIAILTGVNLPMLLDFVFHRDMSLPELTKRLLHKGRAEMSAHHTSDHTSAHGP